MSWARPGLLEPTAWTEVSKKGLTLTPLLRLRPCPLSFIHHRAMVLAELLRRRAHLWFSPLKYLRYKGPRSRIPCLPCPPSPLTCRNQRNIFCSENSVWGPRSWSGHTAAAGQTSNLLFDLELAVQAHEYLSATGSCVGLLLQKVLTKLRVSCEGPGLPLWGQIISTRRIRQVWAAPWPGPDPHPTSFWLCDGKITQPC